MTRTHLGATLAGLALAICAQPVPGGEAYVSLGLGLASDDIDVSAMGVNHPTRCDRLLYANPSSAPTDAACTDTTPRRLVGDAFDLGAAMAGGLSLGYSWERLRLEAEFFGRSHDGETLPAIADSGNVALQDKNSEWSADAPPYYRISNFKSRQLFVNAYYAFDTESAWRPFVGLGVGVARFDTAFAASYLRRTVADGYVTAVGGNPLQPEEWQIAAAGTTSSLDTELSDEVFGYRIAAGLERDLADKARAFVMLRWSAFGDMRESAVWSTIRSHAPVQADGVTPFTSEQALENIGGLTATVGIRYGF